MMLCVCLGDCWRYGIARQCDIALCVICLQSWNMTHNMYCVYSSHCCMFRIVGYDIARQCKLCVSMMLCVCLGDCWRNDIARQCKLCVSMMLCVCLGDCWRYDIARHVSTQLSMMLCVCLGVGGMG